MPQPNLCITVWNENLHEQRDEAVRRIYPQGIHSTIADGLRAHLTSGDDGKVVVRTATLGDDAEQGLSAATLAETNVLLYWAHIGHNQIADETARRVADRVLSGMGLILLHSAQGSKIFRALLGTTGSLSWRHDDRELLWTTSPTHLIAQNVQFPIVLPSQEMYGEPFNIPQPDELVFISSFGGGEVFRSGCCFQRGRGRIFYLSPGHETDPIYHHSDVQQILANAVLWAAGRNVSQDNAEPTANDGLKSRHQPKTDWFADSTKEN